jgi:hypothetical protein
MHGERRASDGGEARQMIPLPNMYAGYLRPPIITRPHRDVVHMRFPNQKSLCRSFIRLQEFYESPYPEIRGNYFTLDDYRRLYVVDHGKPFSYDKDWHGFNVPGRIVRRFEKVFAHDLTFEEKRIVDLKSMAYLIGTWQDADFTHEFAHAMYHLSRRYREGVRRLVKQLEADDPAAALVFLLWLKNEGYTAEVITDEIGAYFATNDRADFEEHFDRTAARVLYGAAKPFRELYAALTKTPSWSRAPIDKAPRVR